MTGNRIIDFYLKLEEPAPSRRVWTCTEVQRVSLENRREGLIVDASLYDPAIEPSSFGPGSSRERLLIAPRHEGCSVFDIREWPLFVHVAKRTGSTAHFEVSSWGELYPTLHSAIEQPIPCREGKRNLPWSLVSANIPCTWETLWYGFSRGFVELSVLERFRDERMASADENGSIALIPLYEAESPAEFVRCFERIASSSGSGFCEDGRLQRLWESVSDSGDLPASPEDIASGNVGETRLVERLDEFLEKERSELTEVSK